ncbi:MAG: right-handed parallel beta-helix repeat-containing protein [Candidatus Latescibacterota bacterium]|nr:MAG: right-handed parallel beta-helix repeat-containing protein [Candidatus Latescibacterota bacterium]
MPFPRTTLGSFSRRGGFFSSSLALLFVLSAIASNHAQAKTWYIKADGSGDAPTIQAGVDSAAVGDTVLVAPGRYTDSSEVLIKGELKTVNVHLYEDIVMLAGGYPFETIIDYTKNDHALFIESTQAAVFRGFEIYVTPDWSGVGPARLGAICSSGAIIEDNRFEYSLYGGALRIDGSSLEPRIVRRNVFYMNYSAVQVLAANVTVENNTIMSGNLVECGTGVFASSDYASDVVIQNNIILWTSTAISRQPDCNDADITVRCNCLDECIIDANQVRDTCSVDSTNFWITLVGEGPQFCGAGAKNFFLQSDSPCAPGNHPNGYDCGLIGAFPVNCEVAAEKSTWGSIKSRYGGKAEEN